MIIMFRPIVLFLFSIGCTGSNGEASFVFTDDGFVDAVDLPDGGDAADLDLVDASAPEPDALVTSGGLTLVRIPAGVYHVGDTLLMLDPPQNWELRYDLLAMVTEVPTRMAQGFEWRMPSPPDQPIGYIVEAAIAGMADRLSADEGLEGCYGDRSTWADRHKMPIPADDCEGYRLPFDGEWAVMLADDRLPTGFSDGESCPWVLTERSVCYACTCGTNPRAVGFSRPNSLGLRDMLGNMAELVAVAGGLLARGGDFRTPGEQFGDPRMFRLPGGSIEQNLATGFRFVRRAK